MVAAFVAIPTYTLTYNAGANGSISGTTPQTVTSGDDGAPVTAVPDAGYVFDQWSDSSTANPRQDLTVGANITVVAAFVAAPFHTLTYSAGVGGVITGTNPQTVVHNTDGTPVHAINSSGYFFDKWDDNNPSPYRVDFLALTDITAQAQFITVTYDIEDSLKYVPVPAPVTYDAGASQWVLEPRNPRGILVRVQDDGTGVIYIDGETVDEDDPTFLDLEFTCIPTTQGYKVGSAVVSTEDPAPYVAGTSVDLLCRAYDPTITLRLESTSSYRFGVWASSIYRVPSNATYYSSNKNLTRRPYSPGDIVKIDPWATTMYLFTDEKVAIAPTPCYTYLIQRDPLPYWGPAFPLPAVIAAAEKTLSATDILLLTNAHPEYFDFGDVEIHALLSLYENAVELGYLGSTPFTKSWRAIPYFKWDVEGYYIDDPVDRAGRLTWTKEEQLAYIINELLKKVGWL